MCCQQSRPVDGLIVALAGVAALWLIVAPVVGAVVAFAAAAAAVVTVVLVALVVVAPIVAGLILASVVRQSPIVIRTSSVVAVVAREEVGSGVAGLLPTGDLDEPVSVAGAREVVR
jgi:hypothetical protein